MKYLQAKAPTAFNWLSNSSGKKKNSMYEENNKANVAKCEQLVTTGEVSASSPIWSLKLFANKTLKKMYQQVYYTEEKLFKIWTISHTHSTPFLPSGFHPDYLLS